MLRLKAAYTELADVRGLRASLVHCAEMDRGTIRAEAAALKGDILALAAAAQTDLQGG